MKKQIMESKWVIWDSGSDRYLDDRDEGSWLVTAKLFNTKEAADDHARVQKNYSYMQIEEVKVLGEKIYSFNEDYKSIEDFKADFEEEEGQYDDYELVLATDGVAVYFNDMDYEFNKNK